MISFFAKTKEQIIKNRIETKNKLLSIINEYYQNPPQQLIEKATSDQYCEYRHLYKKITSMMNDLKITYEKEPVERKLLIFSTWLKTIDDLLDTAKNENELGLSYFYQNNDKKPESPAEILTDIIRRECEKDINYQSFIHSLNILYNLETITEKPKNAQELIKYRKQEGTSTATALYELIKENIIYEKKDVKKFFISLGNLGCLVDSIQDIQEDIQKYSFLKNRSQALRMYLATAKEAFTSVFKYPQLIPAYLQSVNKIIASNLISKIKPKYTT